MANWRLAYCLTATFLFLLLASLTPVVEADYLTQWMGSSPPLGVVVNSYPGLIAGESCVVQASVVYCVGGLNGTARPTNFTYAATLTPLGVGQWRRLSDYSINVAGEACVADYGYLYCIGGFERDASSNATSQVVSASYFAPITSDGLGGWTETTGYPFDVFDQSCAVSSGTVYCVGGVTSNSTEVSSVEYAQLSASGISRWQSAAPYPLSISAGSCVAYAENMYCVGGLNAASRTISSVYYTHVADTGLSWTRVASYPTPVAGHSCVVHYPGLYCVGGVNATAYATRGVFFTYLNSTNLSWIPSTFYPIEVQSLSCVTYSSYFYCVGGYDGQSFVSSVYYSTFGTSQGSSTGIPVASSSSTAQTRSAGGPASWVANYDSLFVTAGVALVIVVASLASKRRSGLTSRKA